MLAYIGIFTVSLTVGAAIGIAVTLKDFFAVDWTCKSSAFLRFIRSN